MAHCFPIRLPPRLHAGSDAYPGWSQSQCRLQRVFICTGFSTALTKFFGAYLNQNSRDWYSTARVSKRPSHKVNRLLTRAVLYRRPNVACYDLGVTPNNLVNAVLSPTRDVDSYSEHFWISRQRKQTNEKKKVSENVLRRARRSRFIQFER